MMVKIALLLSIAGTHMAFSSSELNYTPGPGDPNYSPTRTITYGGYSNQLTPSNPYQYVTSSGTPIASATPGAAGGYSITGTNTTDTNTTQTNTSDFDPNAAGVNPADQNQWAIDQGFDGWNHYQDWLASQQDTSSLDSQINSVYDPLMGFLDQQASTLQANKQPFLDQYTGQYDAQKPLLEQARDVGLGAVDQGRQEVSRERESALSDARRLYNELGQGVRQRFGGASSAALAGTELLGRELQRNLGSAKETASQNLFTLQQRADNVQSEFQNKLQSLEAQKQSALAQAQLAFQDRLDQINAQKAQAESDKAAARLSELQALRDRAFQIENYFTQVQGNLQASLQEAMINLAAERGQLEQLSLSPITLQNISPSQFSRYGGGNVTGNQPLALSGQIGRNEEELA